MIVTTTHGDTDDSLLERRDDVVDNDHEHTTVVEYWTATPCAVEHDGKQVVDGMELVHRSVHVTIKAGHSLFGQQGVFGG